MFWMKRKWLQIFVWREQSHLQMAIGTFLNCLYNQCNWKTMEDDAFRCLKKSRPNGIHNLLYAILIIMIFCQMDYASKLDLLYTESKFGWTVVDYTNYLRFNNINYKSWNSLWVNYYLFISFYVAIVLIRTFITTPFYCYYLKMHDCMAAIMGTLVNINAILVIVSCVSTIKIHVIVPNSLYFTKLSLKVKIPFFRLLQQKVGWCIMLVL